MFQYVENIFSGDLVDYLSKKYKDIKPTDLSSYTTWVGAATKNNQLPEVKIENLSASDRLLIIDYLHSSDLSFGKDKNLKNANFTIQKFAAGCSLPEHTDMCVASLTCFLTPTWDINDGGFFHWGNSNMRSAVLPKYNCGVVSYFNGMAETQTHGASIVTGNGVRSTLQMFIKA